MNIKKILILAIFAIAIVGIIAPASAAIESANKDKVYSIESKEKSAANKITWNANGGTIGSKKTISTNVKKGSKIGKLPATPKRSGYTFSGWYTKKSGGSKINVNTKPTKAVTYYAQWKKSTPAKNSGNSKFVGKWIRIIDSYGERSELVMTIKSDGTFTISHTQIPNKPLSETKGVWSVSNQDIRTTYKESRYYDYYTGALGSWSKDGSHITYTYTKNNGKDSLYSTNVLGERNYYYKT